MTTKLASQKHHPVDAAHGVPLKSLHRLAEGTVTRREPGVAAGSRCAVTREGEVVCTFVVQAALGLNDFTPMIRRSSDLGITWHSETMIWPHLQRRYSIFGSVSRSPQGDLLFFGTRTKIDRAGESNWCEAQQGLKENELIWAKSIDSGMSWSEPTVIPMRFPCSAEAPGAMCISRDGTWHACYAPYNTFDPAVVVPRNQLVLMSRSPQSDSWRSTAMMRFSDELSTAAEAWIVELADGRLLGTCWNIDQRTGADYPNPYVLSKDGGHTWSAVKSTGIHGHTTALTPLADGSALFLYVQRRQGRAGVRMALVRPTDEDFGIQWNQIAWEAPLKPLNVGHSEWTAFTFGEPSAVVLPDGTVLVVFWRLEGSVGSIEYVKLRLDSCD